MGKKNKTSTDETNNGNEVATVTTPKGKPAPKSPSNNKPQTPKTPQPKNNPSTPTNKTPAPSTPKQHTPTLSNKTPKEKQNQTPKTPQPKNNSSTPTNKTPTPSTPKQHTPKSNNNNNNNFKNEKAKQTTPKQQTPSNDKHKNKKADTPQTNTPNKKNNNDNMEIVKDKTPKTNPKKNNNNNNNKFDNKKKYEGNNNYHKNKENKTKPIFNNEIDKKKKKRGKRSYEEITNGPSEGVNIHKRQKRVYTITVQNFAPTETKDSLEKYFVVCGTIIELRLKKGLCLIDFEDLGGYEAALNLNQTTLNNNILNVTGSFCSYNQSYPPSKYLFVSNISANTTEKDLTDLFRKYGQIDRVELVKDKLSGLPRGFGFVVMNSIASAQNAISLSGVFFKNRVLHVEFHAPRFDKIVDGKVKVSLVDAHSRRKSRVKKELRNSPTFTLNPDEMKEYEENLDFSLEVERQKNKELEKEREQYRATTMSENDY